MPQVRPRGTLPFRFSRTALHRGLSAADSADVFALCQWDIRGNTTGSRQELRRTLSLLVALEATTPRHSNRHHHAPSGIVMSLRRILQLVVLLASAGAPVALSGQASTVILVRHAEKAAATGDPDLTAAGRARAEELAVVLAQFPLQAVIVSEYRRTQLTAAPTATAHHLTPTVMEVRGDAGASATAVAAALRHLPAGSAALVVGHSNTLGPIIAALGGPRIADLCDGEYATILLLELPGAEQPPRLLRASYGAADSPEVAACSRQMQIH